MTQTVEKRVVVAAATPSGINIEYEAAPRRLYRVRRGSEEWREAVSVTTSLDCLNKAGLPWWGMQQGVEGFIELVNRNFILASESGLWAMGEHQWEAATVKNVVPLLTKNKLTVNHVRDKAGDRGQTVHDALEKWVEDRTMPVPEFYPETEQGYVRGLLAFLGDLGEVKTAEGEVMVASVEHLFAGRYDLEAVLHESNLVTKIASPGGKRAEVRQTFSGRTLLDLKTSKGVYTTHHLQLAAYEGARLECGYPKTQQQLVVHVSDDGTYEAVPSRATFEDFLAVLAVYNTVERIG